MINNILDSLGNIVGTLTVDDSTPTAVVQEMLSLYSAPTAIFSDAGIPSYYITATGAVTTSSTAASVITGMTLTPTAGDYLMMYSGDIYTTGVNSAGNFGIYKDGTLVTDTQRSISCSLSLLGGLVSISLNTIGLGTYTGSVISANGANTVDVRFNSIAGGTLGFTKRSFTAVKLK